MPSKELVSAVAKAIYEKRNGRGCKPWSYQTMSHQQPYLDDAKAAISTIFAALQEPAGDMLEACEREDAIKSSYVTYSDFWRAMLAASPLGEKKG